MKQRSEVKRWSSVAAAAFSSRPDNTTYTTTPYLQQQRICATMVHISRLSIDLHKKTGDAMWSSFSKGHDEALALYDGKKLDECIHLCVEMLSVQDEAPLYKHAAHHTRVSTLVLLRLVVKDKVDFFAARPELHPGSSTTALLFHMSVRCDNKEIFEALEELETVLQELHALVQAVKRRAEAERDDPRVLSKAEDNGTVTMESTPESKASVTTIASSKPVLLSLMEGKPVSPPPKKQDEPMSLHDEERDGKLVMPSPKQTESRPYLPPYLRSKTKKPRS